MAKKMSMHAAPDFKVLFESAPGLYLVLAPNEKYTIVAVSDAYAETTMTKREEILGRGLFEVFPDNPEDPTADGVAKLNASLQSVLKNRKKHQMAIQKYDIRNEIGFFEERYWSPVNSPVFDKTGTLVQIIHRVVDVTDEVRLKLQTEQLIKDLKTSNQELEAFSYSVSHDLRAPLRAVNGYAQMLSEDHGPRLDSEGRRIIEIIRYNATKMGALIDDLLAFSRLGRKEIQRSLIDMNELTEGVLIEIDKSVKHHADIRIGKLHPIRADYGLIHQVVFNLISNAIKYSSKKEMPVIDISSKEVNAEVVFSVKDNGAGFNMNYYNKLFGVFQRLHSQDEFEGTGVGLAIIQRIITKHGGKVWAEGKPNEGAQFNFSLLIS